MNRRGIGRTEVAIGVAVVVVLLIIAVPLTLGSSMDGKRDQVRDDVAALRIVLVEQKEAFGSYVSANAAPRAPESVDPSPVLWTSNKGFDALAWAPAQAEVYGAYQVMADTNGFKVIGSCDLDGDGVRAVFEATHESEEVRRVTDEAVY